MKYEDEFLGALAFSEEQGIRVPNWTTALRAILRGGEGAVPDHLIDEGVARKLNASLQATFGMDHWSLACKCLEVHTTMLELVGDTVGVSPVLTVGDVTVGNKRAYNFSRESAVAQMSREPGTATFNVHAWLTLPSLEIVDFTLLPTYATANDGARRLYEKRRESPGILANHWSMFSGISYHPVVLGTDAVDKLKLLRLP